MEKQIPESKLNDGLVVPAIGFGTVGLKGAEGVQAIISAINTGYRLIDTAYSYENEATVGRAIKQSRVPREELLVTSKLPEKHHKYEKAVKAIQESLYRADLDYYDIYLIHHPNAEKGLYPEAWQALIDAKKWGLIRSIGVSNFKPDHLDRLKEETGVIPSMNQIEYHPYFIQSDIIEWNEKNGVQTESWSPIGNLMADDLLENKQIEEIAQKHDRTLAQVILRWHIQLGTIPIPKSGNPKRQLENLSLFDFELSEEDMKTLSSLSRPDGNIYK